MLREKGVGLPTCAGKDGSSTSGPLTATSQEGLRPVGGGEARMTSREPLCRFPWVSGSVSLFEQEIRFFDGFAVKSTRTRSTGAVGPGATPIRNSVLSMFDSRIPVESVSLWARRTRLNAKAELSFGTANHRFGIVKSRESRLIPKLGEQTSFRYVATSKFHSRLSGLLSGRERTLSCV